MIYFLADTHFNHANIIKYCNRPFKNTCEMNEYIIQKWNSVVKNDDIVYHLGDVGFGPLQEVKSLVQRLNGIKILLRGNHDFKIGVNTWKEIGFSQVYKKKIILNNLLLTHAPTEDVEENQINVFGHRSWSEPYDNDLAIYSDRIEICNPGHFTEDATPEDYINRIEPSRPRNPLLAEIVFLSGEIEKWGTGIKNVYKKCQEENLKVKFEDRKTAFFVVIYRKNLEKLVENTEKKLKLNVTANVTANQVRILDIISENEKITQEEIAKQLKVTKRTVIRNMKDLQEKNMLIRVGSDKSGYWKIIK